MGAEKPIIVHISADYPDSLVPAKTKAVQALVEGTPEFEHIVYSLNRMNGLSGQTVHRFDHNKTAIAYYALPKGLFWERRLRTLANWITQDLRQKKITPDFIQAHKITIEGLIAQDLARNFGCSYGCDIQGGSDIRVLKNKKSLRKRYKKIAQEAKVIFPYAPWVMPEFKSLINLDEGKCVFLPVVPGFDTYHTATNEFTERLVTVFHLDSWPRKNFLGMLDAIKILRAKRPDVTLDIYGQGHIQNFVFMDQKIRKHDLQNRIRLRGVAKNTSLPDILKDYAALILPSKIETFGLVYTEALFSGLPILWNKQQGITGYLIPEAIGYACDPHNPNDIAAGMDYLIQNQKQLKTSITKLQNDGSLDIFQGKNILLKYSNALKSTLTKR